jgi:hypothetical protein
MPQLTILTRPFRRPSCSRHRATHLATQFSKSRSILNGCGVNHFSSSSARNMKVRSGLIYSLPHLTLFRSSRSYTKVAMLPGRNPDCWALLKIKHVVVRFSGSSLTGLYHSSVYVNGSRVRGTSLSYLMTRRGRRVHSRSILSM